MLNTAKSTFEPLTERSQTDDGGCESMEGMMDVEPSIIAIH